VIYGTTAFGLAENLKISRTEAGMFIDKYFYQYPGVKTYMETVSSECFEKGYVETLSGRRRYIPLIKSSRRQEVEAAKRIAIFDCLECFIVLPIVWQSRQRCFVHFESGHK
jgi:DNA polymerase-1